LQYSNKKCHKDFVFGDVQMFCISAKTKSTMPSKESAV